MKEYSRPELLVETVLIDDVVCTSTTGTFDGIGRPADASITMF